MCDVQLGVFLPTLAHSTFGARYEGHNNFCICFIRSVHMCGGSLLLGGGGTLAPKGGSYKLRVQSETQSEPTCSFKGRQPPSYKKRLTVPTHLIWQNMRGPLKIELKALFASFVVMPKVMVSAHLNSGY